MVKIKKWMYHKSLKTQEAVDRKCYVNREVKTEIVGVKRETWEQKCGEPDAFDWRYERIYIDNKSDGRVYPTEREYNNRMRRWQSSKEEKNGRSAGPGDIPIELIKERSDIHSELLANFNKLVISVEKRLEDLSMSYVSAS